jgi:hypothetical protein
MRWAFAAGEAARILGNWRTLLAGGAVAAVLVGCGSSGPSQAEVEACAKKDVVARLGFSAGFQTRCGDLFAIGSYSITDRKVSGDEAIVEVLVTFKTTGRGFPDNPQRVADSCFGENGKLQRKVTAVLKKWDSGWRCAF